MALMNFRTVLIPFDASWPMKAAALIEEEAKQMPKAHLISACPIQFFPGGEWFLVAVWGPR